MKKKKLTQKEMVFWRLLKAFKENPEQWVPAWQFVGEFFIEELNEWILMSYKAPANGVAIFFENPGLIERRKVKGKSGSKYYEYRFTQAPGKREKIVDPTLRAFFDKIAK